MKSRAASKKLTGRFKGESPKCEMSFLRHENELATRRSGSHQLGFEKLDTTDIKLENNSDTITSTFELTYIKDENIDIEEGIIKGKTSI